MTLFIQRVDRSMIEGIGSGPGVTGHGKHTSNLEGGHGYFFEETGGENGRTITQECSYDDPVRGPVTWRRVSRMVNGDTMENEMFIIDREGRPEKMMEMTLNRTSK